MYLIVADGKGNERVDNVHIIDTGKPAGRLTRMLYSTQRVYSAALKLDADIYHIHDPELLPKAMKLRRRGKKVIYDAHEDLPEQLKTKTYLNPSFQRILGYLAEKYLSYCAYRLSAIVTATDHIAGKFSKNNKSTITLFNYPLLSEFKLSNPKKSNESNHFAYVGSISEARGILQLIQSLEMARQEIRLNLVGRFSEPELEKKARSMSGWQKVKYHGYQNRDTVTGILSESIAGLVTLQPTESYRQSLPVKMFEYMAAGIPVIASDFKVWREIIRKNDCGICVAPMKPEEIARAMAKLTCDPEITAQMGRNGRRAVEEKYNWEQEQQKLFRLYEAIVSS